MPGTMRMHPAPPASHLDALKGASEDAHLHWGDAPLHIANLLVPAGGVRKGGVQPAQGGPPASAGTEDIKQKGTSGPFFTCQSNPDEVALKKGA